MNTGRKKLKVLYKNIPVGTLAETDSRMIAFQYDHHWIQNGFSISPFSLPLKEQVFVPIKTCFDGLFGVFADSLPDAWGKLLLDRMLMANGIDPNKLNMLDRLAIVGDNGAGALEYRPVSHFKKTFSGKTLDELAAEIQSLFEAHRTNGDDHHNQPSGEILDTLFAMGGSSGGARPKVFLSYHGEEWLVKFPYHYDPKDNGVKEFQVSQYARSCGIDMCETKLFPSEIGSGYFGAKRFDRPKKHMISAAGLLEVDFENSITDYHDLMKLTKILSKEKLSQLEEMYRRMVFNVLIGNQDDHLKNFAWLFDENIGWHLSPAYDLTTISTAFGEHTTLINGKGKNITDKDFTTIGEKTGLSKKWCVTTVNEMKNTLKNNQYLINK